MQFTEEQIRRVVRAVKERLGDDCDYELLVRITREVLRRLARDAAESSTAGGKQPS
ncbi:MAG: hypothetical protein Q9P90_13810 [candidate division KSB1 bacterium]|nr:hypothetical protein [candidate division KSB1 bacterium]